MSISKFLVSKRLIVLSLVVFLNFTFVGVSFAGMQKDTKDDTRIILSGVVTKISPGSFVVQITKEGADEFITVTTKGAKITSAFLKQAADKLKRENQKKSTGASQQKKGNKIEKAIGVVKVGDSVQVVGDSVNDATISADRVVIKGSVSKKR